ncbi:MAG TPA: hypothetical protein VGK19_06720 [Capsulimonadaceae bacterium]
MSPILLAAMTAAAAFPANAAAPAVNPASVRTLLYRVTVLEDPKNRHFVEARAINNRGEVVGVSVTQPAPGRAPEWHGFIYHGGKYNALPPLLGNRYSEAVAINDGGVVAGTSSPTASGGRAVIWRNGTAHTLPAPSKTSRALAISNKGIVVGSYGVPGSSQAAWWNVSNSAKPVPMGKPLAGYTRATAVSDAGDVVTLAGAHSYIVNGDKSLRVGTLGGSDTMAVAINSQGDVVGFSNTQTDLTHAFLWRRGVIRDVSVMRAIDGTAGVLSVDSINNQGVMVGTVRSGMDTRAMVCMNNHPSNLNHLIPHTGLVLDVARAINDHGQIVGQGHIGQRFVSFLLTPLSAKSVRLAPASALMITPATYQPAGPLPGSKRATTKKVEPGA